MIFINTKRIDTLGRLVIPMEIRKQLNISENTDLKINIENDLIIIKKIKHDCIICSKKIEEKKYISNTFIDLMCENCIESIARFYNMVNDKKYVVVEADYTKELSC